MSTPSPSPFIRTLRGASPALWPTRLRLMGLKSSYKAGAYSGHPEGMLDSIDHCEDVIRLYKNGTRRPVRPAAAPDVASAPKQVELDELTARSHRDGGPFEPGLEAAEHRLATMAGMYATGSFRGHPEDMLEDIELEERLIRRLKAEASA